MNRMKYFFCFAALFLILSFLSSCSSFQKKNAPVKSKVISENIEDFSVKIKRAFIEEKYKKVLGFQEKFSLGKRPSQTDLYSYYYIGVSNFKCNELKKASEVFSLIIKNADNDSTLFVRTKYMLALVCFEEEKFIEAEKLFCTLIDKYSENQFAPTIYYSYAEVLQKNAKFEEAKKVFDNITRKYPFSFEALNLEKNDIKNISGFSVQVGAFFDCENARNYAIKFNELNYTASVFETFKDSARYYRVLIGSFSNKQDAEDKRDEVFNAGYSCKLFP